MFIHNFASLACFQVLTLGNVPKSTEPQTQLGEPIDLVAGLRRRHP